MAGKDHARFGVPVAVHGPASRQSAQSHQFRYIILEERVAGEVPIISFLTYLICLVSLAMTVPSTVIAQSDTAFDGTYAGVSNSQTGGVPGCDPFNQAPRPLTVSNGTAQYWGGYVDLFVGNVSPQGDFKVVDSFANIIIGKIDPSGKATGRGNVGEHGCVFTIVWQRQ